jgi:hypothetical protein
MVSPGSSYYSAATSIMSTIQPSDMDYMGRVNLASASKNLSGLRILMQKAAKITSQDVITGKPS